MSELNTLLTSEDYREHTAFWERALNLIEGDFRLRQNWQSYALPAAEAPNVCELTLAEPVAELVNDLGRGKDIGAFVVVLAAVFQVLRIYTGAETVFADSPGFGESVDERNGRVPLIFAYDPALTVRDYLDRVRDLVAQSYTYQDFPLREFAETTLKRDLPSTNVLIQLPGVHKPLAAREAFTSYDLVITIHRDPKLSILLEGRASLLSTQFLENFGRHLSNAIAGLKKFDVAIGSVSLVDEAERTRLLELAWTRDKDHKVPPAATVLDLFRDRVSHAPERVAIATSDVQISYGELDDKSTRLAQFILSEYGVQAGDVIAVLSLRSELWIVALLGILKAGAVYLPLDPEYPEERIRFMIEDAGARALLIHSECLPLLTKLVDTPMFALDLQLDLLEPVAEFNHRARPAETAYIIYTSGSTGKPKGVVLQHAGLVNMVVHHVESFGFDHTDRLTQFYSPCFDGSILEVFVTFLAGGTLVLAGNEVIKDPQQFSSYIAAHGVTTVNAPPMYLDALDWENLPHVSRVISAGDQARAEAAHRLAQNRTYNNSYGPTEATVCATNYQLDPAISYGSRIPVGRPLRNLAIYLLDDDLNLVPEGAVGEIWISGIGLAKGYLNRDDLTAQSFVANPFVPGERLYRTGDLGVWLPDGNLELTGRKDTQVKVRGFRIELGEIEAHLLEQSEVEAAIVVVREEQPGDKRLVAFVSPAGALSSETLREQLKGRLPAHMVPSTFVLLDQMPLNHNGKVDRRALASMPLKQTAKSSAYEPPENEVQEKLARIWSEVLGRENIGIHDNFFELGGDSILIIQVVSTAHEAGLKLSAQQVFEHQTIAALANVAVTTDSSQPLPAEQGTLFGPLRLTPVQRWFFKQPVKSRHHYNQSVKLEVPSGVAPEVLAQALDLLIEHHDTLRLRFFESNGIWEQVYAESETNTAFGTTDLSDQPASAQDVLIELESARLQGSLDLSSGPIVRLHLFQLGEDRPARLLFIIHHLAVDGVSWRILFEDFYQACRALQAGEPVRFPPKTSSFRDWGARLQEFSQRHRLDQSYWLNEARASAPRLPLDYEVGLEQNTVDSEASVTIALSEAATYNLLQEAPKAFNTQINEVLMTTALLVFQEWTGAARLLVDLEGHGREDLFADLDLSRTVGWFTSLYPLLLETPPGVSPTDALKHVKEQMRAVPLRGIEYGIGRYLGADQEYVEKLESQPPAEILFNYLGQIDRVVTAGEDWKLLLESDAPEHAPNEIRSHVLEIEGVVHGGCLRLTWKYSRNLHERATIERIAGRYSKTLQLLVQLCTNVETRGFTPSDFPAARLDQKTLDALVARIQG